VSTLRISCLFCSGTGQAAVRSATIRQRCVQLAYGKYHAEREWMTRTERVQALEIRHKTRSNCTVSYLYQHPGLRGIRYSLVLV
jgi:hypothetical protein